MDYDFNDKEKEICAFLSAIEMLNNVINRDVLKIGKGVTDVSVQPNGIAHEKLFLAICVDFITRVGDIFPKQNENTLELLRNISEKSLLTGRGMKELKKATQAFLDWLEEKSNFSNVYFPCRGLEVSLSIKNKDIIAICGNSAKHNLNHLDGVRKILFNIFEDNKVIDFKLSNKDIIFLLRDFNDTFAGDGGFIAKYVHCLAYFMNELRWAIYYSLKPVFDSCYIGARVNNNLISYEYERPTGLSEEGFDLFWDLMNEMFNPPYINRFKILGIWLKPNTYCFSKHATDKIEVT